MCPIHGQSWACEKYMISKRTTEAPPEAGVKIDDHPPTKKGAK